MFRTSFLAAAALVLLGAAPNERYAEGQVWEYRTRPSDAGSVFRIQKIEESENAAIGKIYHISIVGVHFAPDTRVATVLGHLPVSRATLDASVTALSKQNPTFPDAADGIAEWRRARGGVFTISLAEVVTVVEQTLKQVPPPASEVS